MTTRPRRALVALLPAFVFGCPPPYQPSETTEDPSTGTTQTFDPSTTDGAPTTTEPLPPPAPHYAVCGDGEDEDDEQCDDGNQDNTDACRNNCLDAFCGDDIVWVGHEECDDGDLLNHNACNSECEPAICGDGLVWNFHEECDDGNAIDNDACTNACKLPACGDGILSDNEACDNGSDNAPPEKAWSTDCTTECQPACGDGQESTNELCDDGNLETGDGCSSTCSNEYVMFATKDVHSPDFGSVAAGDAICKAAATAAKLTGTYLAWLSDDASFASTDLPTGRPLIRTDGLPIVSATEELVDGDKTALNNPINLDEYGNLVFGRAWTGTNASGTWNGWDCTGWTFVDEGAAGVGLVGSTDRNWTFELRPNPISEMQCTALHHLYCFRKLEP